MYKIILLIAVVSLIGSLYYFFIEKDLLYGSITFVAAIAFNLIYAMLYKVNVIKD